MLMVRTRLAPSAIHGLGVFAAEAIARGTEVWRFTPGFDLDVEPRALDALPAHAREWLLVYGYLDPRLGRFILCCDDARYINHSAAPNLRPDFAREPHGVDLALRDIAPGEELTVDYALVDGILP